MDEATFSNDEMSDDENELEMVRVSKKGSAFNSDVEMSDLNGQPLVIKSEQTKKDDGSLLTYRLLEPGDVIQATVINAVSPDLIYLRHHDDDGWFSQMQAKLDAYCENMYLMPPIIGTLEKGTNLFVYSDTLRKWCRGRFMELTEPFRNRELPEEIRQNPVLLKQETYCTVFLVDYAMKDVILHANIRMPTFRRVRRNFNIDNFEKMVEVIDIGLFDYSVYPLMRFTVRLHNVASKSQHQGWTREELVQFTRMIQGHRFEVRHIRPDPEHSDMYFVDMRQIIEGVKKWASITHMLVYSDIARFAPGHEEPITHAIAEFQKPHMPAPFEIFSVQVAYIVNPDLFFVFKTREFIKVQEQQKAINKFYKDLENKQDHSYRLFIVKPGMACIARYSDDGNYYRAKVLQCWDTDEKARVTYVDFGNSEDVRFSDLYVIVDQFLENEILCIPCRFDERIAPPEGEVKWPKSIKREMERIMMANDETNEGQVYLQLEVLSKMQTPSSDFEECLIVVVKRFNQTDNLYTTIADELVEAGMASRVSGSDRVISGLTVSKAKVDSWQMLHDYEERFKLGEYNVRKKLIQVKVTNNRNPNDFWIRIHAREIKEYYYRMEYQLSEQMEKYYENVHPYSQAVKFEAGALITFWLDPENGQDRKWQRGEITKRIKPNDALNETDVDYEVFGVDSGCKHILKRNRIFELPQNYKIAFPYAIRCKTTDLKPLGGDGTNWTQTALSNFSDWTSHNSGSDTWEYYIYLKTDLPVKKKENEVLAVELVAMEEVCAGPFDPTIPHYTAWNTYAVDKGWAIDVNQEARENRLKFHEDLKIPLVTREDEAVKNKRLAEGYAAGRAHADPRIDD